MPKGVISFKRQVIEDFPEDWDDSEKPLLGLDVRSNGTIEDNSDGLLQVDFANKLIGGGVLNHVCFD